MIVRCVAFVFPLPSTGISHLQNVYGSEKKKKYMLIQCGRLRCKFLICEKRWQSHLLFFWLLFVNFFFSMFLDLSIFCVVVRVYTFGLFWLYFVFVFICTASTLYSDEPPLCIHPIVQRLNPDALEEASLQLEARATLRLPRKTEEQRVVLRIIILWIPNPTRGAGEGQSGHRSLQSSAPLLWDTPRAPLRTLSVRNKNRTLQTKKAMKVEIKKCTFFLPMLHPSSCNSVLCHLTNPHPPHTLFVTEKKEWHPPPHVLELA